MSPHLPPCLLVSSWWLGLIARWPPLRISGRCRATPQAASPDGPTKLPARATPTESRTLLIAALERRTKAYKNPNLCQKVARNAPGKVLSCGSGELRNFRSCPKVAGKLLRGPRLRPSSTGVGRVGPDLPHKRPSYAKIAEVFQTFAELDRRWPKFKPTSTNLDRVCPMFGRVGPNSATIRPTLTNHGTCFQILVDYGPKRQMLAQNGQNWPNMIGISGPGEVDRQLLDNFGALEGQLRSSPEAHGPRGNFPRRVVSLFSAIWG